MRCLFALLAPLLTLIPAVSPADEQHHESLQAHVHGVAQLFVVQEARHLHIEFSSPAANLVGFEHSPNTEAEKSAVQEAISTLQQGRALFILPESAACTLSEVEVDTPLAQHRADPRPATGQADTAHPAVPAQAEDPGHANFHAHYQFTCDRPASLKSLNLELFSRFPGIDLLHTQVISKRGQRKLELAANQPGIAL